MKNKNEVEVVIGGQVYKLISDEPEDYMQKLASYINKKIGEVFVNKQNPTINQQISNLYITINIADDYLKKCDEHEKTKLELDAFFQEYTRIDSENEILKQKIKMLETENQSLSSELGLARKELADYIDNFEN